MVINPFGPTFDNVDIDQLFKSVIAKTKLENNDKYSSQKNVKMSFSKVSNIGQFKLKFDEKHLKP